LASDAVPLYYYYKVDYEAALEICLTGVDKAAMVLGLATVFVLFSILLLVFINFLLGLSTLLIIGIFCVYLCNICALFFIGDAPLLIFLSFVGELFKVFF
jgi:hypothetical protein